MKHVVCTASSHRLVLVTGFGAFPGARTNPTAAILARLERLGPRLSRLGIELRCVLFPVVYAEIDDALRRAADLHRPAAILHLGLAGRRRMVCVETRAVNRAGPLHPDAKGRQPARQTLAPGLPQSLVATCPAAEILAAIRRSGVPATRSIDAGDYLCNATLFASLAACVAPSVGFLHVPRTRRQMRAERGRPTVESLTRAVLAAVLVMGRRRHPGPAGAPMAPSPDVWPAARSRL